ncbi:MAG: helix-turn-helix domain-containing protein [Clostridia bacterium]|nr:helix-turn-helix domain-containing protein [Clostridia bacterium]
MKNDYLKKLKYIRQSLGMSQLDLATSLGIERSTVAKYETGDREPNLETLCKIADLLQVSLDELLGRN